MVYIHGGQFSSGASNLFPAYVMAAFYNVVVVSINYRLGALGFLSTADENSPGNYGILDQLLYSDQELALLQPGFWRSRHRQKDRDIVSRVIAQSGSALADWALIQDKFRVQNTSLVFGRLLGCPIDSSWKLVNCLKRGRSFYELGNAEFQWVLFHGVGDEWYEGWRARDWRFLDTTQEAAYVLYKNESLAPAYSIEERWFNQKVYTRLSATCTHTSTIRLPISSADRLDTKLLLENKVPVYMYVLNTTTNNNYNELNTTNKTKSFSLGEKARSTSVDEQ
ncbi:unnamed protein product [Danaus chrysippus]|uniref:(African queen) hypothetical protein n=1 Tax=Danaus chrysippus TaxID=151541 RepID=A0A8J2R574_9NEOP|nr:unnamed protein product [Danaus chrysippus]